MMYPPHEIISEIPQTRYAPGTYRFPPVFVGGGYQSLVVKATKVGWSKGIDELIVGHLEISNDGRRTWRHMATWRDTGADMRDEETGDLLGYSFIQLLFSARPTHPVFTSEHTWLRVSLECKDNITTTISMERA
jgi:hypothetical protein